MNDILYIHPRYIHIFNSDGSNGRLPYLALYACNMIYVDIGQLLFYYSKSVKYINLMYKYIHK